MVFTHRYNTLLSQLSLHPHSLKQPGNASIILSNALKVESY